MDTHKVVASIRFEIDGCPEPSVVEEEFEFRLVGKHIHVCPVSSSHPQWEQLFSYFWRQRQAHNPFKELDNKCQTHEIEDDSYNSQRKLSSEIKRNCGFGTCMGICGERILLKDETDDNEYLENKKREERRGSWNEPYQDSYPKEGTKKLHEGFTLEPPKTPGEDLIVESLKQFRSEKHKYPWENNKGNSADYNIRYPSRFSLGQSEDDGGSEDYQIFFDDLEDISKLEKLSNTVESKENMQNNHLNLDKQSGSSLSNSEDNLINSTDISFSLHNIIKSLPGSINTSETIEGLSLEENSIITENNSKKLSLLAVWSKADISSEFYQSSYDISSVRLHIPLENVEEKIKVKEEVQRQTESKEKDNDKQVLESKKVRSENEESQKENNNHEVKRRSEKVLPNRKIKVKKKYAKFQNHSAICPVRCCAQKEKLKAFYRYYKEIQPGFKFAWNTEPETMYNILKCFVRVDSIYD